MLQHVQRPGQTKRARERERESCQSIHLALLFLCSRLLILQIRNLIMYNYLALFSLHTLYWLVHSHTVMIKFYIISCSVTWAALKTSSDLIRWPPRRSLLFWIYFDSVTSDSLFYFFGVCNHHEVLVVEAHKAMRGKSISVEVEIMLIWCCCLWSRKIQKSIDSS